MIIWDEKSNLVLPNEQEVTPEEVWDMFPITKGQPVAISIGGDGMLYEISDLRNLCEAYGAMPGDDAEATLKNAEKAKVAMQERIAAESEHQTVAAAQMNRLLENLLPRENDADMMEVAELYPEFATGRAYNKDDIIRHGKNPLGDSQLYRVLAAHVADGDAEPGFAPARYRAIGYSGENILIWAVPTCVEDAYNIGDYVSYNGAVYVSEADGNTNPPDGNGWKVR